MTSTLHRLRPALYQLAIVAGMSPALAWAQQRPRGPTSAPAPLEDPTAPDPGATVHPSWPWIAAALVVLALVWWAMAYRRRDRLPC